MNSTPSRKIMPSDPASARRRENTGSPDVKFVTGEEYAITEAMPLSRRKKNKPLLIGTWNVRSLIKTGKLENTIQEMKRLQLSILGLSEIKWSDNGIVNKDDVTLYYSGKPAAEKNHHYGVGMLIKKEMSKFVTNFVPYSDRCMLLQFNAKPFNLSVLQVYAPTARSTNDKIESFYKEVEELIQSINSQDMIIILGDMNAKIGRGAVGKTVGDYGLGERNERGDRLLQFCVEKDLIITNTWYQHPPRRLYTWTSPRDTAEHVAHKRALSKQLLEEREESEVELQKVINKNSELKRELADNDVQLTDARGEVDRLQGTIDTFNQCASTHEVALARITQLEEELDFEKAFDNVKHEKLMHILNKTEIDSKDQRIIRNLYWNQNNKYQFLRKIIEGKIEGKRSRGGRKLTWMNNIKSWTSNENAAILSRIAQDRNKFREMVADVR
ncbi:craniofacial development protein 2-like [Leguminivora glycinivorella]|uniref:craniofacial development protein 2-like n=1 Tax=Leguminivora glycinivorella TaxID=1035111 RepID=UPI00200D3B4E|nr:craniofacial development protein 2-like [Leguminivora glycinivorella]